MLLLIGLFACASPAVCQTNDIFYRSWHWLKEPSAGRAAGLAGAMTAVPDDASSLESNPGALASLSRAEIVGAVLSRESGRTVVGDALRAGTGMGFFGIAGRISTRWSAGFYASEPVAARIDLAPLVLTDGSRDQGSLRGSVREGGLSTAWRATGRLHLGARFALTRLRIAGEYRRQPETGPAKLDVGTRGEQVRLTSSLGLLYEATPRLRLGLVRVSGASWALERTALSPALGVVLDPGSEYEVRQPSLVSGAASLRLSPKLMLAGQLDYVRYGEIQAAIAIRPGGYAREPYTIFAWEPRLGVEVSLPRRAHSLQLRAGLHGLGLNALGGGAAVAAGAAAAATAGPAAPPAAVDVRTATLAEITALRAPVPRVGTDAVVRVSLGASLVTASGFRLDLAGRFGGERSAVIAGAALRF